MMNGEQKKTGNNPGKSQERTKESRKKEHNFPIMMVYELKVHPIRGNS